ncbi:exodeoxyribonuclease VII small subunit, partial [Plesiomonas shigelloides]
MARAAKTTTAFASTLPELEQIVTRLDTGALPLEQALTASE